MRMLLKVKIPHDPFNAAVKDGTAGKKIQRILAELKPEAVYFTELEGHRGVIMIVNVADRRRFQLLRSRGSSRSTRTASFTSL